MADKKYVCNCKWCRMSGKEIESFVDVDDKRCPVCRGAVNVVYGFEEQKDAGPAEDLSEGGKNLQETIDNDIIADIVADQDASDLVRAAEEASLIIRGVARRIGADIMETRMMELQRELCNLVYQEMELGD